MNVAGVAVGALALAGLSFGAGRMTASANASASAVATPATIACNNHDRLADMVEQAEARHKIAVQKAVERNEVPIKVPNIDASTAH